MRYLNKLVNLEELGIRWPEKNTGACLRELNALSNLRSLYFSHHQIHDSDTSAFLYFPKLRHLHAENNYLTDAAIASIAQLKELEVLQLSGNPIQGNGLQLLTSLPCLKELYLDRTQINDEALSRVSSTNATLEVFGLASTKVAGPGLSTFRAYTGLKLLGLAHSPITDAGLTHLSCDRLESVDLDGTAITEHALDTLTQLPRIHRVTAHGCDIKYGATIPSGLAVASQVGRFEWDYDYRRTPLAHKFDEGLIRTRLENPKVAKLDLQDQADLYACLGEYERSIKLYDRALYALLNPGYSICSGMANGHKHKVFRCYDGRGMALAATRKYDRALADFNGALEISRPSAVVRAHRGYVYWKTGKLADALSDLNRAIDIKPKFAPAYFYRSQVHRALGNELLAIQDATTAAQLNYQPEFVERS